MGATGWQYIEPWQGGVEETMAVLQNRVFAEYFSGPRAAYRPADLAELWSGDEDDEDTWAGFMATHGTHSIVDIRGLVPSGTRVEELPAWTTMRQVSEAEIVAAFGHDKPTRAEFERLSDITYSPMLEDDGRGRGRCLVLFRDGVPEAVVFWGHSGD